MAALFLDEKISATAAIAIVLAVTGAGLVSWQRVGHGPVFGNPLIILCALVSAFLNAISLVLTKYFLEDSDFWEFYASFRMWFAPWMLLVILLPEVRRGDPPYDEKPEIHRAYCSEHWRRSVSVPRGKIRCGQPGSCLSGVGTIIDTAPA